MMLAWFAGAYGVLMLHSLPGEYAHAVCGPWGCYPPLQALAAMHGFWLLLVPPVGWLISCWPAHRLRFVGGMLIAIGVVSLAGVIVHEYLTWYRQTPESFRGYFPQRILYRITTLSDFPILQIILAGVVCTGAARWIRRSHLRA